MMVEIKITWISDFLYRVTRKLVTVLIFVILAVVMAQILMRYGFSSSLIWSEDLVRALLIWLTFLGASIALHDKDLVGLNIIDALPSSDNLRQLHKLTIDALSMIFVFFMGYYGYKLMMSPSVVRQSLSTMPVSMMYVYASAPVSAVLMGVFIMKNIIGRKYT